MIFHDPPNDHLFPRDRGRPKLYDHPLSARDDHRRRQIRIEIAREPGASWIVKAYNWHLKQNDSGAAIGLPSKLNRIWWYAEILAGKRSGVHWRDKTSHPTMAPSVRSQENSPHKSKA